MQTRVRALGHPVHQMVIVFPLGLLVTGTIFDLVRLITGNEIFGQVGFWNITAGVIGAIVAATTGWLDWTSIPAGTRAKRIGLLHGTLNGLVLVLFAISWLLRLDGTHQPGALPFTLELLALVAGSIAAWFGGELVDRLGIGVHEGAHPDAASSLS
ncbi:putative membrane protein [Catenuloplanes nepalensis]|uniref:Membrane protein n=1 Tax=Catenuloplanes nepalensis TaxID=587533 RepID=A0ABT9MPL1_9ACTN|nr:DUF2231 domain-containing protein [Catenuloplanes nepalensis]MDP9793360.1 putative membrane protein [Catenuloplanes nepalensis]